MTVIRVTAWMAKFGGEPLAASDGVGSVGHGDRRGALGDVGVSVADVVVTGVFGLFVVAQAGQRHPIPILYLMKLVAGMLADYAVVPAAFTTVVSEGVSSLDAAPLTPAPR